MRKLMLLSARNAFPAFSLAFSMLLFSVLAAAQTDSAAAKSSLRPWTGVWTFIDDATKRTSTQSDAKATIEIRLTRDGKGLEISRKTPDQPDIREYLIPDGAKRSVEASNCTGWQASTLVPEAGLILSSSESNCKDTGLLSTTNVKMFLAADRMVDILALKAAGQTRLATRRLSFENDLASEGDASPAYVTAIDRMALSEPWKMKTIIQLSKMMEFQALEAVILEKKVRLDLSADSLKELKSAKAPNGVIDLLVALAYPDKFHIEKNGAVELRPWIASTSSTTGTPITRASSLPLIIENYPGMFYNCYSVNGYYSLYAYPGYAGGCYSYYSPTWWDYPMYVNTIVVGPGGGSGSSGGRPDNGRLTAGTGYVQIEPHGTGRHARPRDGYSTTYSGPVSASSGGYAAPSYSSSSGSYSSGSSGSSGASASPGGYSSGGASASPGGYSSGSGSGGTAVPR